MPDGRKVTKRRISTWVGNTVCTHASCRMQSGECGKKNVRTGRIFTRFFHHTKRSRAGAEQARRLRSQPPERARRTAGSGKNGFTFPAVCGMLIINVCSPRGNALYHSQRKRTASHRKSFAAPVCFGPQTDYILWIKTDGIAWSAFSEKAETKSAYIVHTNTNFG